jgi:uncharacterized protein YciI
VSDLEPHTLVLLRWPADKPDYSDEELERLQVQHLAFLGSMRDRGVLLASGPLTDQDEEGWRGICVYSVPPEEARRLAAEDPSVQARRLEAVAFSWLTGTGSAVFGT